MSGQMTLAEEPGLSWKRKEKKRKSVLREMDRMIPWERLVNVIAPCYSQKRALGGGGRNKPMPLEWTLRIHFLQQWFGYSDPGMEEALYEIPVLRQFEGIDLGRELIPDESTILRFRRLLEQNGLAERIFAEVLREFGLVLQEGKMVDATLILLRDTRKTGSGSGIRRCVQRRKATSGTLA